MGSDPDSTASDATTLGEDGPVSICDSCKCVLILTSSSMVCGDIDDCTIGSELGVDDHSFKLPELCESSSWTVVTSWCAFVVEVWGFKHSVSGLSCHDVGKGEST